MFTRLPVGVIIVLYPFLGGVTMLDAAFVFPAIKGFQAHREYFASMVPLGIIPQLFRFVDDDLPPEIRAQRTLNRSRIPEMCAYIIENPDNYVFSSLTVSVDGQLVFQPLNEDNPLIGHLHIPMDARFLINDGQHRQAAIAEAIKRKPELKKEHISVVFYRDEGLQRSQQMFSDLNRYAIRPTKSINILYNSREEDSIIAKRVVEEVEVFKGLTEKEKTALSNRSKALFTLSAICTATSELVKDLELTTDQKSELATVFWNTVETNIPEWGQVKRGEIKSSELRQNSICSLSITLVALGAAGGTTIKQYPDKWKEKLGRLRQVDWRKSNPTWEGLVFVNGKVAANRSTQKAMTSYMNDYLTKDNGENNA